MRSKNLAFAEIWDSETSIVVPLIAFGARQMGKMESFTLSFSSK
jgi:hypothetical protein